MTVSRCPALSCECWDSECRHRDYAADSPEMDTSSRDLVVLTRIDYEDHTGTIFCPICAEDALGSGVYTEESI